MNISNIELFIKHGELRGTVTYDDGTVRDVVGENSVNQELAMLASQQGKTVSEILSRSKLIVVKDARIIAQFPFDVATQKFVKANARTTRQQPTPTNTQNTNQQAQTNAQPVPTNNQNTNQQTQTNAQPAPTNTQNTNQQAQTNAQPAPTNTQNTNQQAQNNNQNQNGNQQGRQGFFTRVRNGGRAFAGAFNGNQQTQNTNQQTPTNTQPAPANNQNTNQQTQANAQPAPTNTQNTNQQTQNNNQQNNTRRKFKIRNLVPRGKKLKTFVAAATAGVIIFFAGRWTDLGKTVTRSGDDDRNYENNNPRYEQDGTSINENNGSDDTFFVEREYTEPVDTSNYQPFTNLGSSVSYDSMDEQIQAINNLCNSMQLTHLEELVVDEDYQSIAVVNFIRNEVLSNRYDTKAFIDNAVNYIYENGNNFAGNQIKQFNELTPYAKYIVLTAVQTMLPNCKGYYHNTEYGEYNEYSLSVALDEEVNYIANRLINGSYSR